MSTQKASSDGAQTVNHDLDLSLNVGDLKRVVSFLESFEPRADDAFVRFGDDGARFEALGPATNCMGVVRAPTETFEAYSTSGLDTGLPLNTLSKLVTKMDEDSTARLTLGPDDRLQVHEGDTHLYDMALTSPEMVERHDIPDIGTELSHTCTLDTGELADAMSMADLASDHYAILVNYDDPSGPQGEHTGLLATGDTDRASPTLDTLAVQEASTDGARAVFSDTYWGRAKKAVPTSTTVQLLLADDMPMVFRWARPSAASDETFDFEAFYAPRIE